MGASRPFRYTSARQAAPACRIVFPDAAPAMDNLNQFKPLKPLPNFIFMSRWLQAPLYFGLIVAQSVYVYRFMVELWHLVSQAHAIKETEVMLIVLGLIDVVMIANLLIMVIVGGYETFVSRLDLEGHPDQPEWLSHVNAGVLKVKLATAIIGISSIHLLKTFINAPALDDRTLLWQTVIHLAFVVSALSIALTERLTHPPHPPAAHRA
jgi:uncharacterized protein (TIGR00645 family)